MSFTFSNSGGAAARFRSRLGDAHPDTNAAGNPESRSIRSPDNAYRDPDTWSDSYTCRKPSDADAQSNANRNAGRCPYARAYAAAGLGSALA